VNNGCDTLSGVSGAGAGPSDRPLSISVRVNPRGRQADYRIRYQIGDRDPIITAVKGFSRRDLHC
jgi:mRNA-degrading endonuclease RelE of RelBE toxin-antitoxin system